MVILGLDQADETGLTYGVPGIKPKTELLRLGGSGMPEAEFVWKWGQALKSLIGRVEPDVLAYERPFFSQQTAASGVRLMHMEAIILTIAYGLRIRLICVDNGSWKSKLCGTNKFNKKTRPYPPLLECEKRGIEVEGDHNRADSYGVWFYAALKEDPKAMREMDTPLFAYS